VTDWFGVRDSNGNAFHRPVQGRDLDDFLSDLNEYVKVATESPPCVILSAIFEIHDRNRITGMNQMESHRKRL
jgi:hypothetical protein